MPLPGQILGSIVNASTDPAANNEIVYTADQDMIVHALFFLFTTDANVANRNIGIIADDGTGAVNSSPFFKSNSSFNHPASTVAHYSAFEGAPISSLSYMLFPLPAGGLRLRKGDRLSTQAVNRQVGDDYSLMRLQVEHL